MPYLKNVHWVDSGRRLRDRFLEHIRSTRLADRPPHWPPLYIPWSQRRRHVSIGDPFLLKKFNRKAQNWGQNDNLLVGSKGWPSSESARLSPMWPGFKSRHRAICGLSLLLVLSLAPRGFSPGTPVFLPVFHFVDVLPPNHYLFISSDTGHFNQPDWMRTSTLFSQSLRAHVMLVFVLIFI